MKILVFHQPYPMGNYKLNQVIAEYFQSNDHEVYILEQLNGRIATEDYIQQILDLDLDPFLIKRFSYLNPKGFGGI